MVYRFSQIETPIENPFKHDALGRQETVNFVAELVERTGRHGPFVLAIDAPYGSGKSTFISMLRSVLTGRDYYSVQFNAWQVGNSGDPLVPMVSVLDQAMRTELAVESRLKTSLDLVRKVTAIVAKRGAVAAAKAATLGGLSLDKEYETIAAAFAGEATGDLVGDFQRDAELAKRFRDELAKAVQQLPQFGKKPTLVFFIDELDRCRPDFAISLLERIKHMFDIENVVFVLSIDKRQLEAVTAAIYGAQINAIEYLRKFIDIEFGLPRPSSKRFIEMSLNRCGLDEVFSLRRSNDSHQDRAHFVRFFAAIADVRELSLRTQERCITRLKVVLEQTPYHDDFSPVLVALLVILRSVNEPLFSQCVQGRADLDELLNFFHANDAGLLCMEDRVVIESHLVAEIKDDRVRKKRIGRYQAILDATHSDPAARDYANRFMIISNNLMSRMHMPGTATSIIARRVDMAAAIRD
jgi:hypothetical protein